MRIKVLSGGRKNIELPLSDAELNFQMRRIGIEETVPICRLVEVSEQDNPLHKFEGQTVNMDEVNFFAKRMKSMTEYERKVLSAYAEDYGVATMKDLINLTFSMKGLSLLTDFSDARQVGVRLYMDEFLGMSEEEKDRIFKRFYQIDKSHSEQGSGLGLAIAKRIVDLSGGTITVNSKENVGTTMIVSLPVEDETNRILIV